MRTLLALVLSLVALDLAGSGREIAPRPLVPAAYNIGRVSTAFAADRFLTAWPFGTSVVGVFSDADGRRISDAWFPLVHDERGITSMQLVGTGDSWALFWQNGIGTTHRMAHIDADGKLTRIISFEIPQRPVAPIVWNGTHFMTVTEAADAVIFDRDGTVLRLAKLESADYRTVAAAGSGFAAMSTISGITAQRVDAGGVSPRIDVERVFSVPRPHSLVTAQNDAGDVLAIWALGPDGVKSAFLRRDGSVTEAIQLPIDERQNIRPLHLVPTDGGFRLFFTTDDGLDKPRTLRTVLLDRNGAASGSGSTAIVTFSTVSSPPMSIASSDALTLFALPSEFGPTTPVRSIAVPHDGRAPREEVLSIAPARQSDPAIVAASGRYLAVFTQWSGLEPSARAVVLTPAAEPIANTTVAPTVGPVDLASNGNEVLAIGMRDRRLTGARITRNGIRVDREPLLIAEDATSAAVTWAGNRWIVAWNTERRIFTVEVSLEGKVSAPRALQAAPTDTDTTIADVALAFDGRNVLVVWHEPAPGGCVPEACPPPSVRNAIFAARLDDAAATIIAEGPGHEAVASNGREFAVLRGGEVIFVRIAGGAIVAEAPRTILDYPRGIRGDITWDGSEYVVALRYGVYRSHLAVHRIASGGFATSPPRHTEVLPAEFTGVARPGIAAERGSSAVIVLHENAPADPARVVAHLEHELQPRPAPPAAPANVRIDGQNLEWDPVPGDVEGYAIEDGNGNLRLTVSADTHAVTLSNSFPNPRVRAFNAGGLSAAGTAGSVWLAKPSPR